MLLSLNWLKEFVEIPKSVTPEELGQKLTLHTVEVEKVEYQAAKYKEVAVGKILAVKPHPNADRLRLALVDIGQKKLEIVCGAPNLGPGQFVPVALVGAVLPSGLEIKLAAIRGVKSNGMLCAEDELGLGPEHAGILILDKDRAKAGQSFSDYLKLADVIFEVDNKSITHRADLWSHYGLARDISAFLNTKFKPIKVKFPLYSFAKGGYVIKVEVKDFFLCPRYMAVGMENLKVAPSPKWLADRLLACGLRPVNNIVDVTNYVMLELGQPLHAFDKTRIRTDEKANKNECKITVRLAQPGEIIETLDGVKRKLDSDMLVIADGKKLLAIAGVMGGANSGINNQTSSVIIEAANFNFSSVRKTAQKLGLRTEASSRFEKGLDPSLGWLGLSRAVELIMKICPGARVSGKLTDVKRYKLKPGLIKLDLNWLNQFIGHKFTAKQVKQILEKLGFIIKKAAGSHFKVTIPSWRAGRDIGLPEDLAEEIVRIYGYNNIKPVMPTTDLAAPLAMPEKQLARKIKNILAVGAGLSEVYNYSFVSADELNKLKIDQALAIKLANPLSEDLVWLRPSLIIGLLKNIKTNQAAEAEIGLYEIGSVFLNKPGEINQDQSGQSKLPLEEKYLALALAGGEAGDLFRKLKGIIEFLLRSLNLATSFELINVINDVINNESGAAKIMSGGSEVGRVNELKKNVSQSFGLKKSVVIAEISLSALLNLVKNSQVRRYAEPLKYPPAVRDLALVVNERILYNNIKKQIINFSDLIKQAELFDVYQGAKLGQSKKSLAFHIIYQAERTLTSKEVDEIQEKLVKHLEKELGAKVRDF